MLKSLIFVWESAQFFSSFSNLDDSVPVSQSFIMHIKSERTNFRGFNINLKTGLRLYPILRTTITNISKKIIIIYWNDPGQFLSLYVETS